MVRWRQEDIGHCSVLVNGKGEVCKTGQCSGMVNRWSWYIFKKWNLYNLGTKESEGLGVSPRLLIWASRSMGREGFADDEMRRLISHVCRTSNCRCSRSSWALNSRIGESSGMEVWLERDQHGGDMTWLTMENGKQRGLWSEPQETPRFKWQAQRREGPGKRNTINHGEEVLRMCKPSSVPSEYRDHWIGNQLKVTGTGLFGW